MFDTLIPEVSPIERIIDRIHRIPKPKHLEALVLRDILMKVHFFPTKEKLLAKARSTPDLPAPYTGIHLYANPSFPVYSQSEKAVENHN